MRTGYEDIAFGAYDVLNDEWIAPPPNKNELKDPSIQFANETRVARMLVKAFNRKAQDYKEQLGLLKSATPEQQKKIRSAALRILGDLLDIVNQVEDDRQFAYSYGWGVPRTGFQNIVYKVFENGPHGDVFHKLVEISDDEGIQDLIKVSAVSEQHGELPYHIIQERGKFVLGMSKDNRDGEYVIINKENGKSRQVSGKIARQFLNEINKDIA